MCVWGGGEKLGIELQKAKCNAAISILIHQISYIEKAFDYFKRLNPPISSVPIAKKLVH